MSKKPKPDEAPDTPTTEKRRSWFARHKILTLLGAVVLIVAATQLGSGGDEPAPSADPTVTTPAETDEADATDGVEEVADDEPAVEEPAEDPADELADRYPVFDVVEQSGTGDSVIAVPAAAGMVTMTHDGSANFAVVVLDAENASTGDLLANTIGAHSGTAAFGLSAISGDPANLQITADGNWTITIAPLASAPALPESGTGDGVFRHDGAAAVWALTHDGSANFAVLQYTDGLFDMPLLVNEIGAYSGTVPAKAGPSIVTITADGNWTLAQQ
ncbi:hypothetical protein Xcel_2140 [Xylanimonas cellulosilytica DSM 15894]|uniref:Uncharacterized protein n=1 Tax=Xylanimonas cellulosilytica (strain DSM 15894 / JCM 12276 / CECT 5975 / KCTC 9989 / LMG 20990 / NBRC 107835 / XIL07) TaxID=446471 RepID=D1BUE5_XYLCX|nr:hypothetical protein [Xylanimonas cellulosilytica]ACZ31158.1 hypothetical protein Xcel_2140 [Xylanimonas cellulosilytica DSM 15894]